MISETEHYLETNFDLHSQQAPIDTMDGSANPSAESGSVLSSNLQVTEGDGESVRKLLALLKQHQDALNK